MALFVWCGTGAAVATNKWGSFDSSGGDLVAIALGFGFAISALAYAIGKQHIFYQTTIMKSEDHALVLCSMGSELFDVMSGLI